MKKIILIISILIAILSAFVYYQYSFKETDNLNAIYLIPRDAIYFVASNQPIKNWNTVKKSDIWQHLQTNPYFSELTASANTIDTLLNENKKLFDLLGSKKLLVSTHPISKRKYDYLFVVDLKKTAQLLQFKTVLKKIFEKDYRITERKYKEIEIIEFFNKKTRETLYFSVINNNLIASFTHTLVEASIDQLNEPTIGRDLHFIEINKKLNDNKLMRLFVQYNYVDEFAYMLSNTSEKWIKDLSKNLVFSGFDVDLLDGNKLMAKGYTNTQENSFSYLQAFTNAGLGYQDIAKVAPQRTSLYLSLGFESFGNFYKNYQELQKNNPAQFQEITENTQKIEKLLDIDIQKNFIDWIDDEMALLKLEPMSTAKNNDFALVLKAKKKSQATQNLDFILQQIKKKTPAKFKEIDYKGYPIKFMSIKGFFKLFFGGYFKDLVTPYYTIIDDYVVFSNHPNTLKYIITDYVEKNTLSNSVNYTAFKDNFETQSNLFIYINTPMIFPSIMEAVDVKIRADLDKNLEYFTSFSQIGIQLIPEYDVFESHLVIQYKDQESIQYSNEFTPPTVGPQENDQPAINENPIVVVQTQDPFDVLEINPKDLNAKEFVREYANGKIHVKVPLKDGMKHGIYRAYYKNGELYFKGRFKKDQRVGKWKKYDTEGKRVLSIRY